MYICTWYSIYTRAFCFILCVLYNTYPLYSLYFYTTYTTNCDIHCVQHVAPVAFTTGTGVNDELDGSESKAPVKFIVPNQYIPRGIKPKPVSELTLQYKLDCEVVQSLAKWKRIMLGRLGVGVGEGIYCSSTSIRKGYKGDVTHSAIADQWDYEVRIKKEDRNVKTLKKYVNIIWKIITDAEGTCSHIALFLLNSALMIFLTACTPIHLSSQCRLYFE